MKKFLLLMLLASVLPFAAFADDDDDEADVTVSYNGVVYTVGDNYCVTVEQDPNEDASGDIVVEASFSVDGVTYTLTAVSQNAFKNTAITSCVLPDVEMSTAVFYGCEQLTSVTLPSSLTTLPSSTFGNCHALTTVELPAGLTTIEARALYGTGLTTIVLPAGLTSIGSYAFYDCETLESVTCEATAVPTLGSRVWTSNPSTAVLYVPSESVEAYTEETAWSNYFKGGVYAIGTTLDEGEGDGDEDEDDGEETELSTEVVITPADGETVESLSQVRFACEAGIKMNGYGYADVKVYKQGSVVAYVTTRKREYADDGETLIAVTLPFTSTLTDEGTYKVVIPADVFTFAGTNNDDMTLTYYIGTPDPEEEDEDDGSSSDGTGLVEGAELVISPAVGEKVESLSTIVLTQQGGIALKNSVIDASNFYVFDSEYDQVARGESYELVKNDYNETVGLTIVLSTTITSDGTYYIYADAGLFYIDVVSGTRVASPEIDQSFVIGTASEGETGDGTLDDGFGQDPDNDNDGITALGMPSAREKRLYNLVGQRVSQAKGLVIENGKKVIK